MRILIEFLGGSVELDTATQWDEWASYIQDHDVADDIVDMLTQRDVILENEDQPEFIVRYTNLDADLLKPVKELEYE